MKIEGYLFVPYEGQYRFSFELTQIGGHVRYGEIQKSNPTFDHFWDVRLRARPTLYELVTDEPRKAHMLKAYQRPILNLFKDKQIVMLEQNQKYLKCVLGDGYVEYRVAE